VEQSFFTGFISSYKLNVHLIRSKLTVGAEHRQTKKVYRTEINEDSICTVTQGACETCEHLFELFHELIDNDGKCPNKSLKLVEQETKLELNVTVAVIFGRTSRQFAMKFDLESVQLDDITRLENIINEYAQRVEQLEWNANDRFDHASKLASFATNDFQFRNVSPTNHAVLSDDNRTVCCKTRADMVISNRVAVFNGAGINQMATAINSQVIGQVILVTNQGFLFSANKRYQSIRFNLQLSNSIVNDTHLFGLIYQPDSNEWSKILLSDDTWLINVCNGFIQHSQLTPRPYTWPIRPFNQQMPKQVNSNRHIDVLLDTHQRCLAFRIDDQTEDKWAFYLPEHLQINQLYPIVILNSPSISVSIDS
jgi:hypothetical protein